MRVEEAQKALAFGIPVVQAERANDLLIFVTVLTGADVGVDIVANEYVALLRNLLHENVELFHELSIR